MNYRKCENCPRSEFLNNHISEERSRENFQLRLLQAGTDFCYLYLARYFSPDQTEPGTISQVLQYFLSTEDDKEELSWTHHSVGPLTRGCESFQTIDLCTNIWVSAFTTHNLIVDWQLPSDQDEYTDFLQVICMKLFVRKYDCRETNLKTQVLKNIW